MTAVRSLALGAVGALGLAAGAAARSPSVQVTPRQGSPRTHFVVRFMAPRAAGLRAGTYNQYEVRASGPAGKHCGSSAAVQLGPAGQGRNVSVTLKPPGRFRTWCRGGYAGTVSELVRLPCPYLEVCPAFIGVRILGRFRFAVD